MKKSAYMVSGILLGAIGKAQFEVTFEPSTHIPSQEARWLIERLNSCEDLRVDVANLYKRQEGRLGSRLAFLTKVWPRKSDKKRAASVGC